MPKYHISSIPIERIATSSSPNQTALTVHHPNIASWNTLWLKNIFQTVL